MIDIVDRTELKNHLFHLSLEDSDIPIIVNLLKDKDF